jgi:hypothetical protein
MLPLLALGAIFGWLAFVQIEAKSRSESVLDSVDTVDSAAAPSALITAPNPSSLHFIFVAAGPAPAGRVKILLAKEAELWELLGDAPRSAELIEVPDERSARELAGSIQRDAILFQSPANAIAVTR